MSNKHSGGWCTYNLIKLVDTRSAETCLLQGLRYANVSLTHSLTHSGVDTALISRPERERPRPTPYWNSNRAVRASLAIMFARLLFQYGVGLRRSRLGRLITNSVYTWVSEWVSEWHICISESPQETRFYPSGIHEFKNEAKQFRNGK